MFANSWPSVDIDYWSRHGVSSMSEMKYLIFVGQLESYVYPEKMLAK
jgi:hypothetical protein